MSRFEILKGKQTKTQSEPEEYNIRTRYLLNVVDVFNTTGQAALGELTHICYKCAEVFHEELLDIVVLDSSSFSFEEKYLCKVCAEKFAPDAVKNRTEIQNYIKEKLKACEDFYEATEERAILRQIGRAHV